MSFSEAQQKNKDINMERTIKAIYLTIALSLATSCYPNDDIELYSYDADSYIFGYVSYNSISLFRMEKYGRIQVMFHPSDAYGAFSENEEDQQRYKEKCEYYNDIGYAWGFISDAPEYYENCVQDRDYTSIRVYSDKPYSESLPAGSDLSSCFYMASRSPYKFIASGYKDKSKKHYASCPNFYNNYLNVGYFLIVDGVYPVYGLLSEMTDNDLKLLGMRDVHTDSDEPVEFLTLYIARMPEDLSVHTITVELTDTDGNVIKAETAMDFSKVEKVW